MNKQSPGRSTMNKNQVSDSNEEKSSCPICFKNYTVSQIEAHVNRCLFLSSGSTSNEKKTAVGGLSFQEKRHHEEIDCTYSPKKLKEENVESVYPSCSQNVVTKSAQLEGSVPLAEQMRPSSFQEYIGQAHVLGQNTILRSLLDNNEVPSMILWGPPGCGKTSLAHIISKQCQSRSTQSFRFVKLSATMAGVNDVKEAVKIAKNELASFKRRTILFMDEIHRFNKLQQDIFLPHVESGCIVLIGATTENPSFSLNSALLSRCRVFVLEKLAAPDIIQILTSAAKRLDLAVVSGSEPIQSPLSIDKESIDWLADMCDGDARIALNSLHMALKTCSGQSKPVRITLKDIEEGIKRSHLLYDRKGEEHYNVISAMHKSIRASDDNAALYWLARMLEGGEDPVYIARRLVVCASEDVGLEDPNALTLAMSAMQACKLIGMPECGLFLAHIATYLSRAPKSREVYNALAEAKRCVRDHKGPLPSVPLHLRNAPTKLMKQLGYGAGYNMRDRLSSNLSYMPPGMEHLDFFGKSDTKKQQ
uniref:AAA+ ATPase domain-containing protein n=1 Tax=Cuerna arida TaxID=1464854 RepID=A0A1B6EPV5_9HEMI